MNSPAFFIGQIPVYGKLILAPMDGYSDYPFRSLCRQMGSSISYSEFINCLEVLQKHPFIHEKIHFQDRERPFSFQILDDDPERILKTAEILYDKKPDFFDINMGCCAKSVTNRGAGAGLLKEPWKIEKIFQQMTKTFDIPITGKIRLGWDEDSLNYIEIAKIIEDNGGALIAVHGRTKRQMYTGKADWNAIRQVKETVSIPVLGNGDVKNIENIQSMLDFTQCDGIMIGREAIGNPWIFEKRDRCDIPEVEVIQTIQIHLQEMVKHYGEDRGVILFRKHLSRYIKPYEFPRNTQKDLLTTASSKQLIGKIQFLQN